jgi:hypothetical protein
MPKEDFSTAIAALERRLADHDRKGNELRAMINFLCEEAGEPPKYSLGDTSGAGAGPATGGVLTQIKRDSFYGKKQMTAIREYLEMRRAQGDGPATPQEILEALKAGGYKFEAKSDDIALVGLRALLRKATGVFHKLPGTRAYGLMAWYPGAKQGTSRDNADGGRSTKGRRSSRIISKGKLGRPRKVKSEAQATAEPETKDAA